MKKTLFVFLFAISIMGCKSSLSQTSTVSVKENKFEPLLGETLNTINSAKGVNELFEDVNKLKRISALYPKEWLSDYYVALLDVKLSFATTDIAKKEALLKEAKETIEKLKRYKNAIESEILTLNGYYYYAMIAKNPQKNGRLYYKDVIGSYSKAIAIDSSNPRATLLLSIFKYEMAKATGKKDDTFCQELSKANMLFKKFVPIDNLHPKWGENELKKYQTKSCNYK